MSDDEMPELEDLSDQLNEIRKARGIDEKNISKNIKVGVINEKNQINNNNNNKINIPISNTPPPESNNQNKKEEKKPEVKPENKKNEDNAGFSFLKRGFLKRHNFSEEENKNAGQPGAWAQMSISQAAELMAIPKLERKTFAKEIDALQLSVREMKEEIRKKYEEQNADKPVNTIARNIELKPCPFCGGEGELMISGRTQPNGNIKGYIIVKCTICGAAGKGQCYYGPNVDQWDHDLEESIGGEKAVSAWNMRWKE